METFFLISIIILFATTPFLLVIGLTYIGETRREFRAHLAKQENDIIELKRLYNES